MKNLKLNILILVTPLLISCNGYQSDDISKTYQQCSTSPSKTESNITQLCSTKNLIAEKVSRDWTPDIFKIWAGAGHTGSYGEWDGAIFELKNTILNMNGFFWNYSKQKRPYLKITGENSSIMNGIILLGKKGVFVYGDDGYSQPNFARDAQDNNLKNEKKYTYAVNGMNMNLLLNKIQTHNIWFSSWGGKINKCTLYVNTGVYILGSKSLISNNKIISKGILPDSTVLFNLEKVNKNLNTDVSLQIFPDQSEASSSISGALYVKFSPDTIIDGNTFTLTKQNNQAYAIVLDHSPRVRIINNTFNGFKVPILMDQWSSIVDEKGNVIHPDQFSGDITMNKKGEIVQVKTK